MKMQLFHPLAPVSGGKENAIANLLAIEPLKLKKPTIKLSID